PVSFTSGRLEVRTADSFKGTESWRGQWDDANHEFGGSIYMSYDWSRTWWEFYGAGKELRIFLFYADEKLVGIVPIYIDRIGFKPFEFAVARLVCANIPPKAFNPPVHPGWAESIFDCILTHLLERDRCDLISIGPVS